MTSQENKIPIKGYAGWHPLKHLWIGSGFKAEWIRHLVKDQKIYDPLCRIADETEEDYLALETICKQAGVKTYRTFLDIDKYESLEYMGQHRPPMTPRDYFAVIGETFYAGGGPISYAGYSPMLRNIDRKNLHIQRQSAMGISTASAVRVGKDIYWDLREEQTTDECQSYVKLIKEKLESEGFRVHLTYRGYHSDSCFTIVKPGAIISLYDIQDYKTNFPGWDLCYLPDQSWELVQPFLTLKKQNKGKWWLQGEEDNNKFTHFVNTWLDDWVGYVEETVFDVNMLNIDENHVVVSSYNKTVFDFLKKHKIEPIVCNFRHRYFWDGGIHCFTQDFYREGEMEDYFG